MRGPAASLILVDDPVVGAPFDLRRVLGRGRRRLAAVVEPLPGTDGGPPADADAAAAVAQAAARTAGAPVPDTRYRLAPAGRATALIDGLAATDVVAALLQHVPAPGGIVAVVSRATLPLLEALAAGERTRSLLRVGVTGSELDVPFNLARKLAADGKLHYHEHTPVLSRVLAKRLDAMLLAHAERERTNEVPT
jgi:hypothetical protein